ncbi:MAG: Mur ligase family protein [Patescibacteria group bacterium]|nr:Mur ligase family protein [Patescibacteria group bacterium]
MAIEKHALNIDDIARIHFIGIGGIGMSALARYFLHERKGVRQSLAATALGQDECKHSPRSSLVEVSGSDHAPSRITDALVREGVSFHKTQTAANITDDIGLVVYTEAMPQDHEELAAARKKNIPCMNYFQALGLVANPYYLIAVAGTHGKTTTTAMATDVLESAGLDPTAVIGSLRTKTKSNFRAGRSKYCIVEACEYRRDFLSLTPSLLVITNIEAEHLDYYRDLADIQDAFGELARRVPDGGFIVCNPSDPNVVPALHGTRACIMDYTKLVDPTLVLRAPGMHNLLNAGAVFAVAQALGIKKEIARKALEEFAGTWRRAEYLGETARGALVFDDYGHHPAEIETTLRGFRARYPKKRMIVAFQPHLHSRTKAFFDGFVAALALADEVVLAPIFEARKEADYSISSEQLADAIMEKKGIHAQTLGSYEAIARYLAESTDCGDLIITMGAGAINTVAEILTGKT